MAEWLSLKELNEIIGEKDTTKLIKKFGGQRVYISETTEGESPLSGVIDAESIAKLVSRFAHCEIELPKGLVSKKQQILALASENMPKAEIAKYLGLSTRYVRKVLNEKEKTQDSTVKQAGETLAEEVKYAARAAGLSPADFIRQAYDFFRTGDSGVSEELSIWKKRQRIVNSRVDECEKREREERLKEVGERHFHSSLNND